MTDRWRPVTRLEPADFYAEWLAASERNEHETSHSPVVARGRDLHWIETAQDYRIAMLIGRQVGFPTQGTNVCRVELPAGHHSGRHRHGEEAIHILAGRGFIVVDGRRYDFRAGTTIHVPYMAEHQLFNAGADVTSYVSASSTDLDLWTRLGRVEHLADKGPNEPGFEDRIPAEDGQYDAEGRRIALHLEDAPDIEAMRKATRAAAGNGNGDGHGHDGSHDGEPDAIRTAGHAGHHAHPDADPSVPPPSPRRHRVHTDSHAHGAIYILMGGGESPSPERNGFTAVSVAMTNVFEEVPHTSSHCHSHTEAVLYVLEGVGFSEIDYEHYDWEAGDAVHVPPRMTRHEHFNPSDGRTRTLRIEFGIRYYYEPLWKGYWKVEHRATAIARP